MGRYSQAGRAISIATPLAPDALLLEKISGSEAISELFHFELDLLAEIATTIDFERLLGQPATVTMALPNGSRRHIAGIVSRLTEGGQVAGLDGSRTFVRYRAALVPQLWLLTHRVQSRVFQQQTVWQILETILISEWRLNVTLQKTDLQPRNYCIQYQESDFAFVSRLLEDEGLAYYFTHSDSGPTLIVADGASAARDLAPAEPVVFDDRPEAVLDRPRVRIWEKTQEVRPRKHKVRDYQFQKPDTVLEATESQLCPERVSVGSVTHVLNVAQTINGIDVLETFDYPGGFAARVDGVDCSGKEQPQELTRLFDQAKRAAKIQMERDAARCLIIRGVSDAAHLVPGHRLELAGHFRAERNHPLCSRITRVEHQVSIEGSFTGREAGAARYENRFECLPEGIPFRPPATTPRPRIDGFQTAFVAGAKDKVVDLDAYGRVKVKFHWDQRTGRDQDSSCWVRVAQIWAGKGWGGFFWPRVGHEVVVAFENGDPDRPLVVGSVYNETHRPPYDPQQYAMLSGVKSCIMDGDPRVQFNALVFHDYPTDAYVQVHSEKSAISHNETLGIRFSRTQVNINGPL